MIRDKLKSRRWQRIRRGCLGANPSRRVASSLVLVVLLLAACVNTSEPPVKSGSATATAPRDAEAIVMWTSGEKQQHLQTTIDQFNAARIKTSAGKPVFAELKVANSGPMSDHLIEAVSRGAPFPADAPAPAVVSPSVDHWLARVNVVTGQPVFSLNETVDLALSPVVILTYADMARCLGWPGKAIGYADILALKEDPRGWATCPTAKTEWGRDPLVSFTDPRVSSTARSALFALYGIAADKPVDQLSVADIQDPAVQERVRRFQTSVDHYFPETLKLQTKLFQGPKFVHFAFVEEYNLPWLYRGEVAFENATGERVANQPIQHQVVAIYPKEGTIIHNNPAGIPTGRWMTPAKTEAAQLLVDYLRTPAAQRAAVERGFRPAVPVDGVESQITPQYGLNPSEPSKLLGRVPGDVAEAILATWDDVKKPGIAVLVLDTSGSMREGDKISRAKEGGLKFLDSSSPHNQVGYVGFSTDVHTVIPVAPIQDSRFQIAEAIQRSQAEGQTALYDAVLKGIELADAAPGGEDAIRGVVVLTDGRRTDGNVTLDQLVKLTDASERPVTGFQESQGKSGLHASGLATPTRHKIHIFAIGVGRDPEVDWDALRLLSEATSSVLARSTEQDLAAVLERFGRYF